MVISELPDALFGIAISPTSLGRWRDVRDLCQSDHGSRGENESYVRFREADAEVG
jgi:hypothetical protein